ncbi:MAG: endonuclease/exonuclease/phosphatase family protein [Deltaproteobacteria bacterium]|nr:endonuclease/exonuclease/phosphatase family protein [Deltaproteobacteria bacterium]
MPTYKMKYGYPILIILSLAAWISIACGGTPVPPTNNSADDTPLQSSSNDATFTVMSYNVLHPRADAAGSEHNWDLRKQPIVDLIKTRQADIILLQEVMVENGLDTAAWMRQALTATDMPIRYAVVGGSGTDPKDIFVNIDKFDIVFPARNSLENAFDLYGALPISNTNKEDTIHNSAYLPPDPLTICLSAINRPTPPPQRKTASWAHLRHKSTGREIVVSNLHLHWKHESRSDNTVRIEQLRCVSSLLNQRFPDLPKIVGGDFNAELASEELNLFQGGFGHEDRRFISAATDMAMAQGTWNGFCETCTPALKIDHLFVQNLETETPTAAIHSKPNNQWPSDHCPIIATFRL